MQALATGNNITLAHRTSVIPLVVELIRAASDLVLSSYTMADLENFCPKNFNFRCQGVKNLAILKVNISAFIFSDFLLKVSYFQKDFLVSSILPKKQTKKFTLSYL